MSVEPLSGGSGLPDWKTLREAAQRGETVWLDTLVESYRAPVLRLAGHWLGSADEAEDVAQEVFLRVWQGLPKYRGQAELSTWVYRIAVNVCRTRRAEQARRAEFVAADGVPEEAAENQPDDAPTPEQVWLTRKLRQQARAAIDRLPDHYRTPVLLHCFQGLTVREVAAILNWSESKTWSILHRALRKLRGWMGEYVEGN